MHFEHISSSQCLLFISLYNVLCSLPLCSSPPEKGSSGQMWLWPFVNLDNTVSSNSCWEVWNIGFTIGRLLSKQCIVFWHNGHWPVVGGTSLVSVNSLKHWRERRKLQERFYGNGGPWRKWKISYWEIRALFPWGSQILPPRPSDGQCNYCEDVKNLVK